MDLTSHWALLAYHLPREPSTPRIALWRKLRRLGVAQLGDGLVALPHDGRTREAFDWLADDVVAAGGQATVWLAQPATRAQERAIVAGMAAAIAAEYAIVRNEAAAEGSPVEQRRTLARLRRELQRIRRRDYFPPPERERAEAAVAQLAQQLEGAFV